jgi:hypothetical protein
MINRESFVYYYMKKSGGRYDPNFLIDIMKAFEEWMPGEREPFSEYDKGWNDCLDELAEKLK